MPELDRGPWIQTYTGRKFYLFQPRPEDVCIEDIAHALSNICRFTGHVRDFYSVAQHSVLAAQYAPPELKMHARLHDAGEAYIGDINRPLKQHLCSNYSGGSDEIRLIEAKIERTIFDAFDLPLLSENQRAIIKQIDNRLLMTERRDLLIVQRDDWTGPRAMADGCVAYEDIKIMPWGPKTSEHKFLLEFERCFKCS